EEWLRLPRRRSGLHAVAAATTDVRLTPLAVGLAPVSSGLAWRGYEERAAYREEEEQHGGDSLCEPLRAGRHGFPPLCVGHLDSAVVRYHFSDRTLLRCGFRCERRDAAWGGGGI